MPPRIRVTEEMITEAGFELVRREGMDKLTIRAAAKELHCSTQPILYNYPSAEELRQAVYEKADMYHSEYILPKGTMPNPLLELGMNYVRFAHEEPHLFQFLFQSGQFSGLKLNDLMENPETMQLLDVVASAAHTDHETAKQMFLSLFITAHGCAALLAGNAMEYEEAQIERLLKKAFVRAKGE